MGKPDTFMGTFDRAGRKQNAELKKGVKIGLRFVKGTNTQL